MKQNNPYALIALGALLGDIEVHERICTENNGPHGTVSLTNVR